MSVSALLVDIDNTVYAYGPCHEAGLREAWRSLQPAPTAWPSEDSFRESYAHARGVVKSRVGLQAAAHSRLLYFKEMLEEGYSISRLEQAVELSDSYWRGFAVCMKPDVDCLDVLGECKRRMPIAWVSNYTTKRQIWKLGLLGLSEMANYLVTSEEAGAEKPDPRPFRLALEKLRVNGKTVFAVGDSFAEDVLAARACGMDCAWLLRDQPANAGEVLVGQTPWSAPAPLVGLFGHATWLGQADPAQALDGAPKSVCPVRSWAELRKVLHERLSN